MVHLYIAAGLVTAAIIAALVGRKQGSKANLYNLYIEAGSPAELAAGVPAFYGGAVTVVQGQPQLVAPYSKQPCVWYRFTLEQEQTHRDTNGTEATSWQTVSDQAPQGVLFSLQSGAGTVLVNPVAADVQKVQQYQGFVQPADVQGQSGVAAAVGNVANALSALGNSRLRVTEEYIPLGQQLYAGGVVTEQGGQKLFANDQSYPLVLTARSKADLVKMDRRNGTISYIVAGVLIAAAIAVAVVVKK